MTVVITYKNGDVFEFRDVLKFSFIFPSSFFVRYFSATHSCVLTKKMQTLTIADLHVYDT